MGRERPHNITEPTYPLSVMLSKLKSGYMACPSTVIKLKTIWVIAFRIVMPARRTWPKRPQSTSRVLAYIYILYKQEGTYSGHWQNNFRSTQTWMRWITPRRACRHLGKVNTNDNGDVKILPRMVKNRINLPSKSRDKDSRTSRSLPSRSLVADDIERIS